MSATSLWRGAALGLFLSLGLLACGGEGGQEMAGTGSAGGNPLTFSADYEDSDALPELSWRRAILNLGEVRAEHGYTAQEGCLTQDAVTLDESFALPLRRLSLDQLRVSGLCSLELRPPTGMPLLELEAELARTWRLRFFVDGVRADVDAARFSEGGEIFVLIDVDALLDGVDVGDVLAWLEGEEVLMQLVNNLVAAVRVYADPTPGDGELSPQERTPENIIATLSLIGEPQAELDSE